MDQGKKKLCSGQVISDEQTGEQLDEWTDRQTYDRNRSPDDRYVIKLSEFKWPYK